jgi:hypothetical protein
LYKGLGIELQFSTVYHPQTQGQVENNNKWMETYLCMFCLHQQDNWSDWLPLVEFVYNNHHHPSINTKPFFINFGYHPMLTNVPTTGQNDDPDAHIQCICDVLLECTVAGK